MDRSKIHLSIGWGRPVRGNAAPVIAYRVEAWQIGADGGARWFEVGVTPINQIDVFNLMPDTEFHFRVTPRNRNGWGPFIQTSTPLIFGVSDSLPEFTKILPSQMKALHGKNLSLECMVKGLPAPNIAWSKDGKAIDDSVRHIIMSSNSSSVCRLKIINLNSGDSGCYTCQATNSLGRVSSFARVQVVSDNRICEADNVLKSKISDRTVKLSENRKMEKYQSFSKS